MSMTASTACPLRSRNCPPNLPLKAVPIPTNVFLFATTIDPDNDKSSRFGSCTTISRIWAIATAPALMVKEVTDCGNFQSQGTYSGCPNKVTFSAFVNHGTYSKNPLGGPSRTLIEKRRSLTWQAGLSSAPWSISAVSVVKCMARKRCRQHDWSHDFDTREHDRREPKSESAARSHR